MYWKIIALALVVWAVAVFYGATFGGLIHAIPIFCLGTMVVRRVAKDPDSEFGRWRAAGRRDRR